MRKNLENPNGVQNMYPKDTQFSEVRNVEMGYCTPKWGTVSSPGI
jgi:hypothetical protein